MGPTNNSPKDNKNIVMFAYWSLLVFKAFTMRCLYFFISCIYLLGSGAWSCMRRTYQHFYSLWNHIRIQTTFPSSHISLEWSLLSNWRHEGTTSSIIHMLLWASGYAIPVIVCDARLELTGGASYMAVDEEIKTIWLLDGIPNLAMQYPRLEECGGYYEKAYHASYNIGIVYW